MSEALTGRETGGENITFPRSLNLNVKPSLLTVGIASAQVVRAQPREYNNDLTRSKMLPGAPADA